ncbi:MULTISPECIES: hypothetical protein [Chryseobacterium]|uniref:hypothetical protein n=1 Tax=Chryseobacterium TaxID=59732 RepID=UPI0013EF4562|nr:MULTISPECIES: hypothetical protein [Chryseobacterium]QQV03292.1 hypothetical protein I6I61_02725 [Chryseobacterium sp. FDAARGOS 1104]
MRQAFGRSRKSVARVQELFPPSGKPVAGVQQAFREKETAVCLCYQNSSHPTENY